MKSVNYKPLKIPLACIIYCAICGDYSEILFPFVLCYFSSVTNFIFKQVEQKIKVNC